MKSINPAMYIGVVMHTIITLSFFGDPDYSFLAYFVGAIVIANLIGIALIAANNKKLGAWIFLISSAILVPIGFIGAMGARKILDEEKQKEFYTNN